MGNVSYVSLAASEACKTTPEFLEKIPTDLIVTCRTG